MRMMAVPIANTHGREWDPDAKRLIRSALSGLGARQ